MNKDLRTVVEQILMTSEMARGNDNYLIYLVFKHYGWCTDLAKIDWTENRFESISRARRKAQENNPMLLPSKKIKNRRLAKEKLFREQMRGL